MQDNRTKKNTWRYVGFLLLAGCANLLTRTESLLFNSFMFTFNFAIYVGLLLFWMQSVRERLLQGHTCFRRRFSCWCISCCGSISTALQTRPCSSAMPRICIMCR